MKKIIVLLMLCSLFVATSIHADITERIIYAGDTPLSSTCKVTQTAPMELTVAACSWTTTGQSRVVNLNIIEAMLTELGVGSVAELISQGKAEFLPGAFPSRVRGWLIDKAGNIIERSRARVLSPTVLTITAGETWVVYMVDGLGVTMNLVLKKWDGVKPVGTLNYLIMPFEVPAGTTDLTSIKIEVFTVKPNFPPRKGLFEK